MKQYNPSTPAISRTSSGKRFKPVGVTSKPHRQPKATTAVYRGRSNFKGNNA